MNVQDKFIGIDILSIIINLSVNSFIQGCSILKVTESTSPITFMLFPSTPVAVCADSLILNPSVCAHFRDITD